MRKTLYLLAVAGYVAFVAAAVQAQAPSVDRPNPGSSPGLSARFRLTSAPSLRGSGIGRAFRLAPASGPNLPVIGSGTAGRLTKWLGFNSINSLIGDSTIFEDKSGLVGIGTTTPTSRLTVAGVIESTGGFKFGDGTVQITAGLGSISHDLTLTGSGGSTSPLGVALPLNLVGPAPGQVLFVSNTSEGSGAISALGRGTGAGIRAQGGDSTGTQAGVGIITAGGFSLGSGGDGLQATGGDTDSSSGGTGVQAQGGQARSGGTAGTGVVAAGGRNNGGGPGGAGIVASAGIGFPDGPAGSFNGDVEVTGNLSKGAGSFKIDHPLDPANKYLYHSFVESPDMMNIYNGTVRLDSRGEATIELPDWFQALNRDFRYQLTCIGGFAPVYIAEEVGNNHFKISGGITGMKVSWQVTGVRQDAWANAHRIPVEEEKPGTERGYYLHPELYEQPLEKSIVRARHPELAARFSLR